MRQMNREKDQGVDTVLPGYDKEDKEEQAAALENYHAIVTLLFDMGVIKTKKFNRWTRRILRAVSANVEKIVIGGAK